MSKFLAIILCLLPLVASAQSTNVDIGIRPVFTRHSINFHDEQYSSKWDKPQWELSASAAIKKAFKVKYILIPVWHQNEQISISDMLLVGNTNFGPKAGSKETKQVNLDWSTHGQHRIELTGLVNFPVQPVIVGEWVNLRVEVTGKKEGKDVTDSEDLGRFTCAFGGTYRYVSPRITGSVLAVGSNQLQRFEANLLYRLNTNASISGGYSSETQYLGGAKIRQHGPFLGVAWEF